MRRIDIFVSSPEDVRKERSLVERSIRSIAAEFGVPITVTYSNWRRTVRAEDKIPLLGKNGSEEGRSWLCPCFWEYEDSNLDKDYQEQIPNTGSYDLVVSILWSRLGTRISSALVMPDGGQPQTANEYEVAWVLDQLKRTAGFPELRIYRNLSTPPAPLQPREERESFFKEWDAVQEFFTKWNRQPAFVEACTCYSDLQQFESLFREHFRDFLSRQLQKEVVTRKNSSGLAHWKSAPYRGLQQFELEQAPIFCGRTRAVGEILDALKRQSDAQKPFVLVLGPAGSGKSSLVRAGVLPLLTEVGISPGEGPWRRAVTRPGAGIAGQDPLDALATALLSEIALPELQPDASQTGWQNLASELREQPEFVASRARDILDQISRQEMDHLLRQDENQSLIPGRIDYPELSRHRKLRRAKPKAQLALIIDHLEDLFTAGFPEDSRQRYVAAISALVRTQRIAVIATLQSDFYKSYQRLSELVSLSGPSGRYDVLPPTRKELGEMIRLPANAAGLRFEQDKKTGQTLDEALLDAAVERTDSLPLLEYLLSRLYERQLERKDGLLRFADYRDIGEFDGVLAKRAESAFGALSSDAQHSFDFVFRRLVALASDGKKVSRPCLYKDLIWSPEYDDRRNTGARELVECMLKEGLFTLESESRNVVVVRIADHVLLSNWPRIEQWLIEDQGFVRMRDRVDGCMKLWQKRGRQTHDLLSPGLSLSDGEALINHFHASLSEAQIDYIQRSLTEQKRAQRAKILFGFPILIALASLAAAAGLHWFNKERARIAREEYGHLEQKIAELAQGKGGVDRGELKQLEEKANVAQQKAEIAAKERDALAAELKKAQQQFQSTQQTADTDSRDRAALTARV
ncbi:MAG TPA: ATP-binding protein, partial [Chthoniobacterales bacterium]|nr:ATP-binding protein [Chthoniobacterales bacterium]